MVSRSRTLAIAASVLLTAGCLGQDYRDVDLALSDWDHGWLAVVEPQESFTVGLPEHPQYPDAAWTVVADGDPVLEVVGSTVDRPPPEEDRVLAFWVYDVVATSIGEAPLAFELQIEGEAVDRLEIQVAVVEDACASENGIVAPRCSGPQQVTAAQGISEWEHGTTVTLAEGSEVAVALTGSATRPDAIWQLASPDPTVVDVSEPREVGSRTPGNWARDDASEPGTFLPRSEFLVTGQAPGSTVLRFELIDGDAVVEFASFTVDVGG